MSITRQQLKRQCINNKSTQFDNKYRKYENIKNIGQKQNKSHLGKVNKGRHNSLEVQQQNQQIIKMKKLISIIIGKAQRQENIGDIEDIEDQDQNQVNLPHQQNNNQSNNEIINRYKNYRYSGASDLSYSLSKIKGKNKINNKYKQKRIQTKQFNQANIVNKIQIYRKECEIFKTRTRIKTTPVPQVEPEQSNHLLPLFDNKKSRNKQIENKQKNEKTKTRIEYTKCSKTVDFLNMNLSVLKNQDSCTYKPILQTINTKSIEKKQDLFQPTKIKERNLLRTNLIRLN